MIYLDSSIIYIPKTCLNIGGDRIRLINGTTKDSYDLSVYSTDIFYKLSDASLSQIKDGQYTYEVYTGDITYDKGIAQKGNYIPADCSVYNTKMTFIEYEG